MAASVASAVNVTSFPWAVTTVEVSSAEPGVDLNISHGGPTGVQPSFMIWELVERPTDHSVVFVEADRENDNTSNNTSRVAIDTTPTGDLSGAVIRLVFFFVNQASGGITVS